MHHSWFVFLIFVSCLRKARVSEASFFIGAFDGRSSFELFELRMLFGDHTQSEREREREKESAT
jgi:hypothetical protein